MCIYGPSIQSNLAASVSNFILYLGRSRPGEIRTNPRRAMSPLVSRAHPQSKGNRGSGQHWGMLLFESLSAGALTLLVGFTMVMLAVGLYALLVWPLTFWDLTDTGLEQYGSWAKIVVWSVFAGGSLAGFWCFSGAAFKTRSTAKRIPEVRPSKPRR